MNGIPMFTIVEDSTGREVKLLDHNGSPCAMPISQKFIDEDHRYNYIDGSVGKSPLVQRHEIQLGVDFLPDSIRRRLLRMKMDRSDVQFTPGWGERTVLAWRPVQATGTTLPSGDTWYDLTGDVALTQSGGTSQDVWDFWTEQTGKIVENSGTAPSLVTETPYGAGQSLQPGNTNRWSPGEPVGDYEGFDTTIPLQYPCGWVKAGTASAQITFSFVSNGFEEAGMDALRVTTTDDVTLSRRIEAEDLWDSTSGDHLYTFSGTGLMCCSMWVKGRFTDNSVITLQDSTAVETTAIYLDGDYGDWTKINLHLYADWSTYRPKVSISLASGTGEPADFMVTGMKLENVTYGSHYRYSAYNTAVTGEAITSASIVKPKTGSLTMSFYLPEALPTDTCNYVLAMLDTSAAYYGMLAIGRSGTSSPFAAFYYNGSGNRLLGTLPDITPGVHAITASWGTGHLAMYYDGELLDESTSDFNMDFTDTGAVSIGNASRSPWPLMPLTMRLDSETHAADYADLHATLMDPVSLGTVTAARGRTYEITSLPATPRLVDGATYWTGTITLTQTGYDADYADVTTKEM